MPFTAKLTIEQVREIKQLLANGFKQTDIAKRFGVTNDTISAIKRGKIWRSVVLDKKIP